VSKVAAPTAPGSRVPASVGARITEHGALLFAAAWRNDANMQRLIQPTITCYMIAISIELESSQRYEPTHRAKTDSASHSVRFKLYEFCVVYDMAGTRERDLLL